MNTITATTKLCRRCGLTLEASAFNKRASSPDGLNVWCRDCDQAARLARAATGDSTPMRRAKTPIVTKLTTGEEYIADKDLLALWDAELTIVAAGGLPANLLFAGPSGSGKTVAAKALAERAGLAFYKTDAASMTDPEAWFGTRELTIIDGVSQTVYQPSGFVEWLQKPCVLLVDEVNRVRDEHRGIWLPLLDGSRAVTNPLTGQTVERHPECYIIMTGNIGIQFTGTYAIDPAFMTRAHVVLFDYMKPEDETKVVLDRVPSCDPEVAALYVRFANEARSRHKGDADFPPISTREVLEAAKLVTHGLPVDIATRIVVLNGASDEGGAQSIRATLETMWGSLRKRQDVQS